MVSDKVKREERIKVCENVMQNLSTYYQRVPLQALREKTIAVESLSYTNAETKTDYLSRIAAGLSAVGSHGNGTAEIEGCLSNVDGEDAGFFNHYFELDTMVAECDSDSDTNWRAALGRMDRVKVCHHIIQILKEHYIVSMHLLLVRASALESESYKNAECRGDYLRRIADVLSNVVNNTQSTENTPTSKPTSATVVSQYTTATPLDLDVLAMQLKLVQLFKRFDLEY